MLNPRKLIPVICLATSLAGVAVYAATTAPTTGAPAEATGGPHWRGHHHHAFMGLVLHKLTLTDAQKTQIKAIFASEKSQFEALRASVKTNREALETTAPSSSEYPTLVQQAQANAAQRIKLETETWSQIHASVLTKAQQDSIPGIVAAARAERAAKIAAWKAQHPQASTPATDD
ncbi:MAG: Spy/CpxP family protein refolding chaperone [Steroidobacteraceae bacterium]|jgi:Spy/CpxP family protein refolding chaperone